MGVVNKEMVYATARELSSLSTEVYGPYTGWQEN